MYAVDQDLTNATFQKLDVSECNSTEGCNDLLRIPSRLGSPPIDINTIDYDVEHTVDTSQKGYIIKNISKIITSPLFFIKRKYDMNRTWRNTPSKVKTKGGKTRVSSKRSKEKLAEKNRKSNGLHSKGVGKIYRSNRVKSPKSSSNVLVKSIKYPKSNKQKVTKSIASNVTLDDLISKYAVIKKRSISNKESRGRQAISGTNVVQALRPLKRTDARNDDSFTFFSQDSNEDDIDPVSAIFDNEFLFGGTTTQHEGTTPFPILDKDYDYEAGYGYGKESSHSGEEVTSDESYEEDKEGTIEENNEEPEIPQSKPKENTNVVTNVVKQIKNNAESDESVEEEDDDVDVVREPPIIVLYKGGDSKQLQPSFEYALTHGGLDPRYLTKEPLAGPLATNGFNHNFQVMRGVPIQGNVMQPGRRYPTVGGFNTTQIHAIIQTGQLPTVTMPGGNNATVGVVPVAPADHVGYGRTVNMGPYLGHPHHGNNPYITRPTTYIVRPNYYSSRGRSPPTIIGRVPIRSPSGHVFTTTPRYRPSYRGGPMLRYRGNRNHMARYRPINVGIPRGTRVAIL